MSTPPCFYDLAPKLQLGGLENRLHQFSAHFPLPGILGPSTDPPVDSCYLFLLTWGKLRLTGARLLTQQAQHHAVRKRTAREGIQFCLSVPTGNQSQESQVHPEGQVVSRAPKTNSTASL